MRNIVLAVAISAVLVCHLVCVDSERLQEKNKKVEEVVDDEDLKFLEEAEGIKTQERSSSGGGHSHLEEEEEEETDDDSEYDEAGEGEEGYDLSSHGDGSFPGVDEKDVVVLTDSNFSDFVSKRKHVLVEFYAPWCGHCQALAPEYAAAATQVKDEISEEDDVVLAKVDATEENDLAQKYDIQGFPTLLFFSDGDHRPYSAPRTKDAIISWIKKKIGPAIHNLTTEAEAQKILQSDGKLIVVGFLNSLVGSESQELASVSRLEDDVSFFQTISSDVAELFNVDSTARRPSLVMLKKVPEKLTFYDGEFTKSAILNFVIGNKLPLVTYLSRETAEAVFESPIKKQFLLFATSNDSPKIIPIFEEVAKLFKGKILFVYVELDNEDIGVPVANYFGISGDSPRILAYTGNEDGKKYIFESELTLDAIKVFGENFLVDKLKPFYKSDPVPETNDGDVKVVVGNSFDEIVLDESRDVLLEIYAPWCGHCQSLEPTYNKLAKHLRGINSLVIAKMDGTTNEHPRAKADGFPTLLFFPAGRKSFDPISADVERTVVGFYKFLKEHASIPFKLQKPASKTDAVADVKLEGKAVSDYLKDEL